MEAADALVFVSPGYNYSMPAPLKNALDFLWAEWAYKPAGLVTYGGASGGLRSSQMIKQVVTALKMMPMAESVSIPFFSTMMNKGEFKPNETIELGAKAMRDELARWEVAPRTLRSSA